MSSVTLPSPLEMLSNPVNLPSGTKCWREFNIFWSDCLVLFCLLSLSSLLSTLSLSLSLSLSFSLSLSLERFSFKCRKVIGFALSTRCDWLKRFAPPFHPIRSKTKANCDALACIFPRFASATCNYFEF